jgi:hypothetical protein
MKVSFAIILALCCASLAGCSDRSSQIEVFNDTPQAITDMALVSNNQRFKLEDVRPGGSLMASERLKGEGAPRLEWVYAGTRKSAELCYFTGGMPAKGEIHILPDRIQRRCDS